MNIFGFIKVRGNTQRSAIGADIAERRLNGFLHHVAEVARQLQLARAFYDVRLDLQRRSAHACPCKTRHKADLVALRHFIGQEAARPQELLQVRGRNDQLLGRVIFYKAHRALAADGGKIPFKHAHAGFARIERDDLTDGIVAHAQLRRLEAVLFALLGQQVLLCDLQLFLVRIA